MILLTGATGMVGRQVAELLLDRGAQVTALVRDPARASWLSGRGARLVTGPIDDPATWQGVTGIAAIVHAAALVSGGKDWEAFARPNIRATELAAARARELGVPLVHLSSVAVYGGTTTEPVGSVGEDWPFRPLAPGYWYGRSKREAELAVWREAERGLKAIALRPCVIYGPHDRLFIPGIVRAARRGWLPMFGPGDRPMAIVHARSVATAVLAALDTRTGWGHPYNVTGDGPLAPRDFVAALERGLGRRIRTTQFPAELMLSGARVIDRVARFLLPTGRFPGSLTTPVGYWRGGDPYRNDRLKSALGWSSRVDHPAEIERLASLLRG